MSNLAELQATLAGIVARVGNTESFSTSVSNPTPAAIADIMVADGIAPPILAPSLTLPDVTAVKEVGEYIMPVRPSMEVPELDATLPATSDPAFPGAPAGDLPDDPLYLTTTAPIAPVLDVPAFDAIVPRADFDLPSLTVSYGEDLFTPNETVIARLVDGMVGGTGLAPGVEQAIWERAGTRLQEFIEEANQVFEGMGLSTDAPRLDRYRTHAEAESTRAQAVSAAEAEQKSRDAARRQAVDMVAAVMGYASQVAGRAVKVAILTAESAIALYEAEVTRHNGLVAGYRAAAQAYEAQIQGESQKIEVFRSQVAAMDSVNAYNRAMVQVYRSKIDALNSMIAVYQGRMDAAKMYADMQADRIDIYRARVDAYIAQTRAVLSAAQMREAAIKGEAAKVEVYRAQVEEYRGRVQELSAYLQSRIASLRLTVESYNTTYAEFAGQVDSARADVGAESVLRETVTQAREAGQIFNAAATDQFTRLSLAGIRGSLDLAVNAYNADADAHLKTMQLFDQAIASEGRLQVQTMRQLSAALEGPMVAAYGQWGKSVSFTEHWTAENIDYQNSLEIGKAQAKQQHETGQDAGRNLPGQVAGL